MANTNNIENIGTLGIFAAIVLFLFILVIWFLVVIALINFIWKMTNKSGKKTTADYVWIVLAFFLLFILFGGPALFK